MISEGSAKKAVVGGLSMVSTFLFFFRDVLLYLTWLSLLFLTPAPSFDLNKAIAYVRETISLLRN